MNLEKLRELRDEVTLAQIVYNTADHKDVSSAYANLRLARNNFSEACQKHIEYMLDKHPETVEEAEQELGRYLAQQGLT